MRGTFMSALSNKSFSHNRCVEAALPLYCEGYYGTGIGE